MNARLLMLAVLALSLRAGAGAEDGAVAGRQILAKYQEAVVSVRLVVNYRMSFQGRDEQRESKTDAVGTVLDPSGLTVISLATIDPSGLMRAGMRAEQVKMESEVKDAKIVLADGTELAAQIVLRDKDIDVAFLRLSERASKPMTAVDLSQAAKPQVLDEVVCLNRLSKVANRAVVVSIERVAAIVERPRPFYLLAAGGSSGIGSPVFAQTGAPLGIMLIRNAQADSEANVVSMFSGTGAMGFLPVVIPAADILADAKQALAARKPAAGEPR